MAPVAELTTIFKALFPSINKKNNINGNPKVPALFSGTNRMNKVNNTFHATHNQLQKTITFLLPCFPANFAPIKAKTIEGSIAIIEMIDEPTMLPNRTLNSKVVITDCDAIVCASLSLLEATIYLLNSLLSLINNHISLKDTFVFLIPSKFSILSYGAKPIQEATRARKDTPTTMKLE